MGLTGLVATVTYAYTFVFFTSTVVYALVRHTTDWRALQDELGAWLTVHSVMMVVAGLLLGVCVFRANVLPRWTGITLCVGMLLMAVTAGLSETLRTVSAGVRDLAFAGMGASLLRVRVTSRVSPSLRPTLRDRRPKPMSIEDRVERSASEVGCEVVGHLGGR
jgi:hypothetical protein